MLDLATAFDVIAKHNSDMVLLLVGAEEDIPFSRIQKICLAERDRLHYVRFTPTPERYMMAADIFCLPSYREGFGMTEFGPNCFMISEGEARARPGSVGWPCPFVELRLVDERGSDVGAGEVGEIQLRGPQLFSGYLFDAERTAEAP